MIREKKKKISKKEKEKTKQKKNNNIKRATQKVGYLIMFDQYIVSFVASVGSLERN